LTLPLVFPTHFPFGLGGIEEGIRTHVSIEECLNLSKYFSSYVPTLRYNSCDQSYVLQEKKKSICLFEMYV
jgi:hypothetical protein